MTTTTLNHGRVTWTNVIHPALEDIQALSARFPTFHPLNLQDCLTDLEFPKLDHHDEYIFLVVQFPVFDKCERISRPTEIDIFVSKGSLVTSHRGDLKPMNEMFEKLQADETLRAEWMGHGASPLLHKVLNTLVDYLYPIVHCVDRNIRHVEEQMFADDTRHLLNEVAIVRRDVITLRGIINPQLGVINALFEGKWPFVHEELDPYWGDLGDHLSQLVATLNEYAEVIAGLSETIDTLASHRIDEVVRLLTVVTVLTLPLTLLATIFGMNVVMPFADHPILFFLLIGLGTALTLWLIWYLWKRRWL
jgi:magnesium transporter